MATAKKPQDHKPKAAEDVFVHETSQGTISLPKFGRMKFGILRNMRKLSEDEIPFYLIEALADEEALAVVDELEAEEVGDLFQAWQKDAEVSTGESSAS